MARPVKLREFLKAIQKADPRIEIRTSKGKGSHLTIYRAETGTSMPLPTTSDDIETPYQKQAIRLFGLDQDVFLKGKKAKKPSQNPTPPE